MVTRLDHGVAGLQEALALIESALQHEPAAVTANAAIFLERMQGEALIRAAALDALGERVKALKRPEDSWIALQPQLEKLYDTIVGVLGTKWAHRQASGRKARLDIPQGEEFERINVRIALNALGDALDHEKPWFSCPGWLTQSVLPHIRPLEGYAHQLLRGINTGIKIAEQSIKEAGEAFEDLRSRLFREPWAAILELASHATGYTPHPSLSDHLEYRRFYHEGHEGPVHHETVRGDPSSSISDIQEKPRRIFQKARILMSWLELTFAKGGITRSALARYRVRTELFRVDYLRQRLRDNDTRKQEEVLERDLAEYLFDYGIRVVRQPKVGSYRPDLLALAGIEEVVFEIKATDDSTKIVEGYLQAFRYAHRLNLPRGYYVIYLVGQNAPWDILESTFVNDVEVVTIQVDISGESASGGGTGTRGVWQRIDEELRKPESPGGPRAP